MSKSLSKRTSINLLWGVVFFGMLYYTANFIPHPTFIHWRHTPTGKEVKYISLFESMYYSLLLQTTIGMGDITAISPYTKFLTILQLLFLLNEVMLIII